MLTDGAELLYWCEERSPGGVFYYQWCEMGEEVASLSLEEGQDSLTLHIENSAYPLTLSQIDPETRTAEMTYRGLIFHRLDFAAGTAALEYGYPEEELGESLLASPDGRYRIYRLHGEFYRTGAYDELVAQDGETGNFVRLGLLNYETGISITGDNQLVAIFNELKACSLADGEWYTPLEEFADRENLNRKPLDLICDPENRLILLLSTYNSDFSYGHIPEEMMGTMLLDVYREDWTLIRSIDTGIAPLYSQVYGAYSPGIRLEEAGRLLLGKDEDVVEYLE